MPRAFFAIELTPEITDVLGACRLACVDADPSWAREKWVAPHNLHLTVRFLGDVDIGTLRRCADAARVAASRRAPYMLAFDRIRSVPRDRAASMIWVMPGAGVPDTVRLAAVFEEAVAGQCIQMEPRRFTPHVTLCRARRPRPLDPRAGVLMTRIIEAGQPSLTTMSVREVMLYTSTLTPEGPVYEHFAVVPLAID